MRADRRVHRSPAVALVAIATSLVLPIACGSRSELGTDSPDADAAIDADAGSEADALPGADAALDADSTLAWDSAAETTADVGADADSTVADVSAQDSGPCFAEVEEAGTDANPEAAPCDDAGGLLCEGLCVDTTSDETNCGGCGVLCAAPPPSNARCTGGRCLVTLAAGQDFPSHLALDCTSVYFTNGDAPGAVVSVPLAGGAPVTLHANQQTPEGIAVDGRNLYWSACSPLGKCDAADWAGASHVLMAPLAGGTPTTLAQGQGIYEIAIDSQNLYFTMYYEPQDASSGAVIQVPINGGSPVTLAADQGTPNGIAVDDTTVYWTTWETVARAPIGGGPVVTVATGYPSWDVAIDRTSIYWGDGDPSYPKHLLKAPKGGGAAITIASGQVAIEGLVVDDMSAYWTNEDTGGSVVKVALDGGTPVTLATGQAYPWSIAVDATSVYWVTSYGGTVMKVTPK